MCAGPAVAEDSYDSVNCFIITTASDEAWSDDDADEDNLPEDELKEYEIHEDEIEEDESAEHRLDDLFLTNQNEDLEVLDNAFTHWLNWRTRHYAITDQTSVQDIFDRRRDLQAGSSRHPLYVVYYGGRVSGSEIDILK